ncbi:hypothetical protein OROMI_028009 [Orobanche minor]
MLRESFLDKADFLGTNPKTSVSRKSSSFIISSLILKKGLGFVSKETTISKLLETSFWKRFGHDNIIKDEGQNYAKTTTCRLYEKIAGHRETKVGFRMDVIRMLDDYYNFKDLSEVKKTHWVIVKIYGEREKVRVVRRRGKSVRR